MSEGELISRSEVVCGDVKWRTRDFYVVLLFSCCFYYLVVFGGLACDGGLFLGGGSVVSCITLCRTPALCITCITRLGSRALGCKSSL